MNLTQLKENPNIKSDRFAYAAISFIFKAYADNIRSKEYWPWNEILNWNEFLGIPDNQILDANDYLSIARDLLMTASSRYSNENDTNNVDELKDKWEHASKNEYRRKLNQIKLSMNSSKNTSTNVNTTTIKFNNDADEITNEDNIA